MNKKVAIIGSILINFGIVVGGCSAPNVSTQNASMSLPKRSVSAPFFRDVTDQSGLRYKWEIAGGRPLTIVQTIGNGCAFLDYNNDGNLDILLVGSKVALYQGDGKGGFVNVTASVGLNKLQGNFLGCSVGDIDNDGYDDIYLSAYYGGAFLRNEGGKAFRNISDETGIPAQPFGTASAFGDINSDGYLDLYIGNYIQFSPETQPQLCDNNGIKGACGPRFYNAEKGRLYLGGAGRKFRDVTKVWNVHLAEGKALGAAFADFDHSGKVSLAISNDEMPGDLLQNKGGKFDNIGKKSGVAFSDQGNLHGGMGIDWGDYDNDGKLDLAVATFASEQKSVYHNEGDSFFADKSALLGLAPSNPYVAFGVKWFDADNDGFLDLIFCNGHVQDNIAQSDRTMTYRQPTQLYRNNVGERFDDISMTSLEEKACRPIVGRGLAVGDYDNDGKSDLLIVDSEGTPLLLHNETVNAYHWVGLRLSQPEGGNRNAYGVTVTLEAGGKKYLRHCHADGSFMSSSDARMHFGIGAATAIDRVTIRWSGDKTETFSHIPIDRYVSIKRGGSPE